MLLAAGAMLDVGRAEEAVRLPQVTVQAAPLDLYLPSTTGVSRAEITESRKSDVTQVLDLLPGVNVRQGGRAEPRVDIRGFDQRATLLTLDDVPVYEPWNGIINLDLFPLEMLGGLSVTRGAASALYGPSGMAGTIKLRTTLPEGTLAGAVGEMWRDSHYWDTRASAGVASQGVTGIVGGRYLTSDGFPLSSGFDDRPPNRRRGEDGGTRDNSDRDVKSVFGSGGYQIDATSVVRATVLASRSEFSVPLTTTQFRPLLRRTDPQDLVHAQTSLETRVAPQVRVSSALFYSMYRLDDEQILERVVTTRADSDEVGSITRVAIDVAESNTLTLGGLVRYAWANIDDSEQGHLANPDFTTASLVAEDVHFLLPDLALVTGLSIDTQTRTGQSADWEVDPQGGLYYDLGAWGAARGALSRKTRYPTLRELYDPIQGNANLSAETAFIAEVGYQIARGPAYADVSLFRNDVNGLISSEGSGGAEAVNVNLQDAILQGVETAVGATPLPWLRLDLNYTYLDTSADTGRGGSAPIQHKPPHRFNGVAQMALPLSFRLRLEGLYASSQFEQFGTGVDIGAFGLFNATLARRFGPWVDLYAGCDNLLDEDYEERLGTPQPGRWLFVGMRATFGKEGQG